MVALIERQDAFLGLHVNLSLKLRQQLPWGFQALSLDFVMGAPKNPRDTVDGGILHHLNPLKYCKS